MEIDGSYHVESFNAGEQHVLNKLKLKRNKYEADGRLIEYLNLRDLIKELEKDE